ncbi:arginase family protein [Pseudonocardia sp. TRM90224]|uniref:arginase family protein n=1 Tax=Pseudonocardia sp. TRM90224 TaxID=2812678 RepID=UPI001E602810|nr:arginase family protein [Pseudonocardia sp. TRM90224]
MTVISVPFHLDEPLPASTFPLVPDLTLAPPLPEGSPTQRMGALYEQVAASVAGQVRPLVVSGDCTTSLGVVAGLQRAGVEPAIVWFDAHGDVHTPESSISGYIGGMPLRQLVGGADRTVPDRIGLRPVRESDVVLVDARDLEPPEAEFLAASAIHRAGVGDLGGPAPLPDGPIYLHVDLDVIDPLGLPELLYPAPGGPDLAAVTEGVRAVLATGRVAAVGLACTWKRGGSPTDGIAALAEELVAALR